MHGTMNKKYLVSRHLSSLRPYENDAFFSKRRGNTKIVTQCYIPEDLNVQ
jgi:hypothetical protein